MRKIFILFLLLSSLFFPQTIKAQAIDRINQFDSLITINTDTSITISETIDYETSIVKHGIYRYIPVVYNRNNLLYTAKVKQVSITDGTRSVPYTTSYEKGNIILKIGDPDSTFVGKKTYFIAYTVENALQQYDSYNELYWDITGEGWQIPIEVVHATIVSPHAEITAAVCYSGQVGTNDNLCNFSHDKTSTELTYDNPITYGKNVTVAVALSKNGQIIFPSRIEIIEKNIKDNIILFIIPLPALLMFIIWYKKGRDFMFVSPNIFDNDEKKPQRLRPLFYQFRTPFVYEPLTDITPGEAGLMIDEKVDNRDIIAEIIDLARKKYLKLETITKKGFLGIGENTDYKFTKLKSGEGLPDQQIYLFNSLFEKKDEVLLSDLKGTFYTHMQKMSGKLYQAVEKKKLFTSDPNLIRWVSFILVFIVNVFEFALVMTILSASPLVGSPIPYVLFFGQAIVSLIFCYQLPQKTAVGTNLMLQAKGLKETINRGKWREEIKEKHLFIEEVLPFAVAFGVVQKLAKDMEELNIQPPDYLNSAMISNMSVSSFVNSFSSQSVSSLSYNPSSSSFSGGSGFSGGSSGGGGGGGGGGSW